MTEFMLIFRHPGTDEELQALQSDEETRTQQWDNWFGSIAAQGKFVRGNRLDRNGKVVKSAGVVTDGPFAEIKERLGGYIIVRADNIEEAVTFAQGCPVLDGRGTVEVRPVANSK